MVICDSGSDSKPPPTPIKSGSERQVVPPWMWELFGGARVLVLGLTLHFFLVYIGGQT